mgnify:FL=1
MADEKKVSARKALLDILEKGKGPISGKALVEAVLAYPGVALGGKTPASTVAAVISTAVKQGVIARPERGVYKLPD